MIGVTSTPEPARPMHPPLDSGWGASVFVWGVCALMLLAVLTFIGHYGGSNLPFADDWFMIPVVTREQPITANWIWSQQGEHRIPLPRLIYLALYSLTGSDFRAGKVFNGLALGGLVFAMILVTKKQRGYLTFSDAFLPLGLLNLSQSEILFFGYSNFDTILAGILLLIIVRSRTQLTLRAASLAGICLVLLPLFGVSGLLLVPALALWLSYVGVLHWFSPEPHGKRNSLLILGLVSVALLLTGLYFLDYQKPPTSIVPSSPGLWATLGTSIQFLSVSFGLAAAEFWPFSGLGLLSLLLVTAGFLVVVWYTQPGERVRALGFLLFLGAMISLALGIGWGRSGFGDFAGFAPRYVLSAAPVSCCIYFVWGIYGPLTIRYFAQMCLFILMFLLFYPNTFLALEYGKDYGRRIQEFERDLLARTPPSILAERYSDGIFFRPKELFVAYSRMLRDAGIGPFRFLPDDPSEVLFPVAPIDMRQMTWKDGISEGLGDDPYLVFALQKPQSVYAIRLKYSYENTASPALFQMFWRRSDRNDFVEGERNFRLELQTGTGEKTVTIPVNDTVDQFRIDPDVKPCVFKISEIMLLVPATPFEIFKVGSPNFFIENLNKATIETPKKEGVTPQIFNINGDSRVTLFEHPPSKITYKLTVPENSSLTFGIALNPEIWSSDKGDGVIFEILMKDGMEERKLFSKYIDPKNKVEDRKWHDERIDLSEYKGKEVLLTFITSPGPSNNTNYDWAGWSFPKIITNNKKLKNELVK